MMRFLALLCLLALVMTSGCGVSAPPMSSTVPITGKLELAEGKPIGGLLLTLFPLEGQHPVYIEVADDGEFKSEAIAGKYAYFVAKSTAKNSEQNLKKVDAKLHEADSSRTVLVRAGQELKIVLQ
jgi:hypothetical protein